MWNPNGKNGLWVWYMDNSVLNAAQEWGYDYVMVKAGDGESQWDQFTPQLIEECHARGLGCVAWTYVYLKNPGTEAAVAKDVMALQPDALVFDVEYEAINRLNQGDYFVDQVLASRGDLWLGHAPDLRIAFGNRWPTGDFDPTIEPWPWRAFNRLDGSMPQLYWPDFRQSPQTTIDMIALWEQGCKDQGWPVPPSYPVFPSTGTVQELVYAQQYCDSLGIKGANTWRWGSGPQTSQRVLAGRVWSVGTQEPDPTVGNGDDDMLRPYIEAMGSEEGEIVSALKTELAKPRPNKQQIENIMNRLIALRNEALGE